MEGWLYCPLWALPLGLVLYLLYRSGFLAAKRIAAVLFVFRSGRDGDRVFLDDCTGWVRHRVRRRESRTCEFVLDARLCRGEARVVLLDREKRPLLQLDPASPHGSVHLEKGQRYFLRWAFNRASGTCALRW